MMNRAGGLRGVLRCLPRIVQKRRCMASDLRSNSVPATSKAALAARPSSTSAASAPASAFAASRARGDQLQASSGHPSNKGGTGSGSSSWPGSNGDRRQSIGRRQKSRGARSPEEANEHVCIGVAISHVGRARTA